MTGESSPLPTRETTDEEESAHALLHPWQFLGLTLALNLMITLPAALSGIDVTRSPLGWVAYLGGLSPAIAALLLIYGSGNRALIADYWHRAIDPGRISPIWWVPILLLAPAISLCSLAVHLMAGGSLPPLEQLDAIVATPLSIAPFLFGVLAFGPIPEELGWRGYGLDALQERFSALTASLALGVVWAVWHLPLFFIAGTWHAKLGFGAAGFWWFSLSIMAETVLLTWIYNSTNRSTLAAILFHFSINATGELVPLPDDARIVQLGLWMASAALVIVAFGRRTLSTASAEDSIAAQLRSISAAEACPWQSAGILMSPLRRLVLSPKVLIDRLDLRGDERVLEIGPGPGYFSPALRDALPDGRLTLLDLQQQMLAMTRERMGEDANGTGFVQGDGTALPFADGSFDVVLLVAVLGETPDPREALTEIRRVLRPGGIFSNTEQPGDPDHVPQPVLRGLAEDAGFRFEQAWGAGSNYTVAFRR